MDLTPLVHEGIAPTRGETDQIKKDKVKFFCPYTTTLIELRLDRQPLPPVNQTPRSGKKER